MDKHSNETLCDEELLSQSDSKEDVTEYLCKKYKPLVRREANALYLIGAQKEDLIQEGMIGLFKAIRDFSPEKEASFYSFAKLCILRQMYHAIETSNRHKHAPLNSYVSLSDGEEGVNYANLFGDTLANDPERLIIEQEDYKHLFAQLHQLLSPMEWQVCERTLRGMDYRQIAEDMGRSPKSIDNALQRIRKKLSGAS